VRELDAITQPVPENEVEEQVPEVSVEEPTTAVEDVTASKEVIIEGLEGLDDFGEDDIAHRVNEQIINRHERITKALSEFSKDDELSIIEKVRNRLIDKLSLSEELTDNKALTKEFNRMMVVLIKMKRLQKQIGP